MTKFRKWLIRKLGGCVTPITEVKYLRDTMEMIPIEVHTYLTERETRELADESFSKSHNNISSSKIAQMRIKDELYRAFQEYLNQNNFKITSWFEPKEVLTHLTSTIYIGKE